MVANPLFWMEMSNLEEEDKECLKEIIGCYKQYRSKLQRSVVSPIGNKPSGMSITGFSAELEKEGFLLLFRENTEENDFQYNSGKNATV